MMTLPTAFLPNLPYLHLLAHNKVSGIYVGEQYEKQTFRNRTNLMGPNGKVTFTIPVEKIGYPSPSTYEVCISEHGQWRNKLWQMLRSNYCSTPYWEHYCESIQEHVFNPTHRLVDYNQDWLVLLCKLIGIDIPPLVHTQDDSLINFAEFNAPHHHLFLRRYWQVFEYKFGFQPNLSSLDMLLCIGPESRLILFEDEPTA